MPIILVDNCSLHFFWSLCTIHKTFFSKSTIYISPHKYVQVIWCTFQRVVSRRVEESIYFRLVQYFAVVLFECNEAEDYVPAKTLMNMCCTFYTESKSLMNMCCTFYTESESGVVNFAVHILQKKFEKSTCTQHVYLFNARWANHLQKKCWDKDNSSCHILWQSA